MKNNTYDKLKYLTLRVLPAILTFAGVVMTALNFEYNEIVMIIGAGFITMLGQILGISSDNYHKENK